MWIKLIFLLALAVFSCQDIREQKINIIGLLCLGVAGVLLQLICRQQTWISILGGMMIGVTLLILSCVCEIGVGTGDGCVFVISGVFLGFWENLQLFMTALLLAGGVALFLLTIRKKGKNYKLPFVPFMLMAYIIGLV